MRPTPTQMSTMERFRAFLSSGGGRIFGMVLGVVGLLVVIWVFKDAFGESEAGAESRNRVFICSETLKPFNHTIKEGETYPIKSPKSGNMTGYPAELCYWTKDGKPKADPTPVLVNEWIGKSGPTFCPDCGRLVVPNNPPAREGSRPPPTKPEWDARHARPTRAPSDRIAPNTPN